MDPYSSPYITRDSTFYFISIPSFPANQRPDKPDKKNNDHHVRKCFYESAKKF